MNAFDVGVVEGLEKVAVSRTAESGLRSAGLGLKQMADVPYLMRPDLPRAEELALSNPRAARKQLAEAKKRVLTGKGRMGNAMMHATYSKAGGKRYLRAIEAAKKALK